MTAPRTILPGGSAYDTGPPLTPVRLPSGHKSPAVIAFIVVGTVFLVVVVIGIMAAIAIPVFLSQRDKGATAKAAAAAGITPAQLTAAPYCGTVVTPTMPPATAAYVRALTLQNGRAATITAMLQTNAPGSIKAQRSADASLLSDISKIAFVGRAKEVAATYVRTINAYDAVLTPLASATPATLPAIHARASAASNARGDASVALREQLKLPRSTCSVLRPG